MTAWRDVVLGEGIVYYGDEGEDISMRRVTAATILYMARAAPAVYGMRSVRRRVEDAFDRWEPSGPSDRELRVAAGLEVAPRPQRRKHR